MGHSEIKIKGWKFIKDFKTEDGTFYLYDRGIGFKSISKESENITEGEEFTGIEYFSFCKEAKSFIEIQDNYICSSISFGSFQSNVKKLKEEIETTHGTAQLNEYLNATNIILKSKKPARLASIIDIIARIPELKIFMLGDGRLDAESLSKVIIGWVNGEKIKDIALNIQREGQNYEKLIGLCNKFVNGNMKNFVPWGLSVYQALTDDKEKNLPSYVYYGVNNKEDVILSKIGIPRFALSHIKTVLDDKYPQEHITIENMDNVKSKILQFDENDYKNQIIDNKILKELVENSL